MSRQEGDLDSTLAKVMVRARDVILTDLMLMTENVRNSVTLVTKCAAVVSVPKVEVPLVTLLMLELTLVTACNITYITNLTSTGP
jgi:hypothetical protein